MMSFFLGIETYDLRLDYRGEYGRNRGRIEVYRWNSRTLSGEWGTVCDDGFEKADSDVVCRQLGYLFGGIPKVEAYYGSGSDPILIDNLQCGGMEDTIASCRHNGLNNHDCSHSEDAGVVCYVGYWSEWSSCSATCGSSSRYRNFICNNSGSDDCTYKSNSGRCQTLPCPVDGNWNGWTRWSPCPITCGVGVRNRYRQCSNPYPQYGGAECVGETTDTLQCNTGVKCPETYNLRLYYRGSYSRNWGRIEVYKRQNDTQSGEWGTICDDSFGKAEADVVCRTIGYIFGGIPKVNSFYGGGHRDIFIDDLQCNGTEETIANCSHDEWKSHNCGSNEEAGVVCYSGYWSAWSHCDTTCGRGTRSRYMICSNNGNEDCRHLSLNEKCQSSPCAVDGDWSTWGPWSDCSVTCEIGTRNRNRTCTNPVPDYGGKDCSGSSVQHRACEIEFNCPVKVRLVGGNMDNQGRVEVYYNRTWGTICDDGWDDYDANVICKMLNYSYGGTTLPRSSFVQGAGVIWMDNVECNSNQINITECHHNNWGIHNCQHQEDAGVLCYHNEFEDNVKVRLVGGRFHDAGRVEVYFMDAWGRICDNNWDDTDATVICRMLGFFHGGIAYDNSKFEISTSNVWLDYVRCEPGDDTIIECQHSSWSRPPCPHEHDASVLCLPPEIKLGEMDVRLVGGDQSDRGMVQVLVAGEWGLICNRNWNKEDANSICGILGKSYTGILVNGSVFGNISGRIWQSNISCYGNDSLSLDCSINILGTASHCSKAHAIGVWCTTKEDAEENLVIKLVGGDKPDRGRVEIFFMDKWGTVCGLDETTAGFICGMEEAIVVHGSAFGPGGNGTTIWLDNLSCHANETSILNCSHNGWGNSKCSHKDDSGVWCISKSEAEKSIRVRLVGSKYSDRGRVEINFMDKWGTICNNGWDDDDAAIFCRFLGYHNGGIAVNNLEYGIGEGIIWLDEVGCNSSSANITDCYHKGWGNNTCDHSQDASVICISGEGKVCSRWGNWSECSVTCGHGTTTRSRKCKIPDSDGLEFDEDIVDVAECSTGQHCPIDGEWGNWSQWSSCSSTCESGIRTRRRECDNPATQFGGHWCIGNNYEAEECVTGLECPINGDWSRWNEWSACSATCQNGTRTRTRYCNNPQPMFGGTICPGSSLDGDNCHTDVHCPINGQWSQWTDWTSCSATCEKGIRRRSRNCNNPPASFGGHQCVGNDFNAIECITGVKCPIHGMWSSWSRWTHCDVTCGNGTVSRSRLCNNPVPHFDGKPCEGDERQITTCIVDTHCPVDGDWGSWSQWSTCSVSCGNGSISRSRNCNNPAPRYGGRQCSGSEIESTQCLTDVVCPVDESWGYWSPWSACSVTCRRGLVHRNRSCDKSIVHGGRQCNGTDVEFKECLINSSCPVDGQWSIWNKWSDCSVSCGCGTMQRKRDCNNPPPNSDGMTCIGKDSDMKECFTDILCKENCGPGMFLCQDNKTCIMARMSCDGIENCPEGDDEINCLDLFFTPYYSGFAKSGCNRRLPELLWIFIFCTIIQYV